MFRTKQNLFSFLINIDRNQKDKQIYLTKTSKLNNYSKVTYLGCVLNECFTGESMAMQVCAKVTSKLKFLYSKKQVPFKRVKEAFV